MRAIWTDPPGFFGWLQTVQNGPIVDRLMLTILAFFVMAGIQALLMRVQLARPENQFLDPELYNQLFTMHGSTMMFLVAVPMMEAFAEFLLPITVGARELPFPRMTAFLYWEFLLGGALFYVSFFVGGPPDSGWFAYTPLSNSLYAPGLGVDYWLLALDVAQIAAIGDGFEIVVGILKFRAPGMSLNRMPLYLWSVLVMGLSLLFGFTPLFVGTLLLQLDRHWGTHFFDPVAGGDPLLWQHLFWIFGHPDVYIMFIPATGIVSMVVATFTRRETVGYTPIVLAMVATGFISFGLWVHHMFATGLPVLGESFFTAASMSIAIPSGIQIFAFIATIWRGRPVFKTPLLFVIGFIFTFVLGGLSGVMLASVPFDLQVTDSFFVVGHFHYVLIGGVLFPTFAGLYYWLPKMSRRMLSERLGAWNFWVTFVGFNLTFFPMHISGLLGMPRRVYTYPAGIGLEWPNFISSVGAFVLAVGILLFFINLFYNVILGRGAVASNNPWGAGSIEWSAETPPPNEGYRVIPIVRSREPLWDQERLDRAGRPNDRWMEQLVHGLARAPTNYRATLISTVVDAVPDGIVRLAMPSYLPLFVALMVMLVFAALLYSVNTLAILPAVAGVVGVIAWMWPPRVEREFRLAGDSPMLHGVPVYHSGPRAPGWWGMMLTLLVFAVGSACLVFSYFYLREKVPDWPPAGIAPPRLIAPLANLLVLVAAAVLFWWAERSVRAGERGRTLVGMAAGLVLGIASLAFWAVEFGRLVPALQATAYGSLWYTIGGWHVVLVALGLLIGGVTLVQAWLGYFNVWRFLAIQNTAIFWTFIVLHWAVVFGVLYLAPYVI